MDASVDRPLQNAAFVVSNLPGGAAPEVRIDGQSASARHGWTRGGDGEPGLVVFVEASSTSPVRIALEGLML